MGQGLGAHQEREREKTAKRARRQGRTSKVLRPREHMGTKSVWPAWLAYKGSEDGEGKGSPAPGLQRFRIVGGVRGAGRATDRE